MKTRAEYLSGAVSRREYYSQFVTPEVKETVIRLIGKKRLFESTDEYLNDIPARDWDNLPLIAGAKELMRQCGDFPTMLGERFIYKEAALQIVEGATI